MSALVAISLGSNVDPENQIRQAIKALREIYGDIKVSPVYQTQAVGFDGDDFLNLAVSFETDDDVYSVASQLKTMEDSQGRDRSLPKFSSRSIDLDLLIYDDLIVDDGNIQVPRYEILENAFVLKPLSDIQGDCSHPFEQKTYLQLWEEMEPIADRIALYELDFG